MPELPDVEVFRRYLNSTALNKLVDSVSVENDKVLEVSRQKLSGNLVGEKLTGTSRHGKYLFASISNERQLYMHFGMTGFLRYYRDTDGAPDHSRLIFELENGYRLAYDCQRMFGRVGVVDSVDQFIEERKLGPDALSVDEAEAVQRLGARSGQVKSTLMNQRVLAGIGNIYSDEILFQARIHPASSVSDLDEDDLRQLVEKTKTVLTSAIYAQADPDDLPGHFLIGRRSEEAECPVCGGEVEAIRVGGRRGFFCPQCQKR